MNIRKTLLSGILASTMALSGAVGLAQDSTPVAEEEDIEATPVGTVTHLENVALYDAEGVVVAHADVWEDDDGEGVWFSINSEGETVMPQGWLGVHVYERGVCDAEADPPFSTAGQHFNPTNEQHGDLNADPSHAGDLGNLEVDENNTFEHEVLAENLTFHTGPPQSLNQDEGTALIISSGEDDLETDPDGNAGEPWACAVLFPPVEDEGTITEGTPEATPEAEATPVD